MRIKVLDVLSFVLLINRQFYEVQTRALSLPMHSVVYLSVVPGQVLLGLKVAEKHGRCLHLWSSGLGPTRTKSF